MSEKLVVRLREAISRARTNPYELALRMKRDGSFITDLLKGRKKTINVDALTDLAVILDCDMDYLVGLQEMPRRTASTKETLPVGGTLEMGAFRGERRQKTISDNAPVIPDPRYPPTQQTVYLKVGDPELDCGIEEGSLVLVASPDQLPLRLRPRDLVVVEEERDDKRMLGVARIQQMPDGELVAGASADGGRFPMKAVVGIVLQVINIL